MLDLRVRAGIVTGHDHKLYDRNRQDALQLLDFSNSDRPLVIAAIADGCGSGAYSEVGALSVVQYAVTRAYSLLKQGVVSSQLPAEMFRGILDMVNAGVHNIGYVNAQHRSQLLMDYYLFTFLGMVVAQEKAIIFTAGDGLVIIDEEVIDLDNDNQPDYLAYNLVDAQHLPSGYEPIQQFDVWEVDLNQVQRLAIGTDAWRQRPDHIAEFWGQKHQRGLQRQMNVWQTKRGKRLSDDAALVTLEVVIPDSDSVQEVSSD